MSTSLKAMVHSGPAARSVDDLKKRTRSCMLTLQRRPERVKKYFDAEHIAYAA